MIYEYTASYLAKGKRNTVLGYYVDSKKQLAAIMSTKGIHMYKVKKRKVDVEARRLLVARAKGFDNTEALDNAIDYEKNFIDEATVKLTELDMEIKKIRAELTGSENLLSELLK